MKCAYCEHKYSKKVKSDQYDEVLVHVRKQHPKKWATVKPNDIWTVKA